MLTAQNNTLTAFHYWLNVGLSVEQEQNVGVRAPLLRRATIFDGMQRVEPAVCRDLSFARIGLVHFVELQSEEVYVEVVTGSLTYGLPCRIRWQQCYGDQVYISNGEVDPAAESLLMRLKRLNIWDAFARRFSQRRPFFAPVSIHSSSLAASWEIQGVTTDSSDRGVGFLIPEPLRANELVDVTIGDTDGLKCTVRFEIRWCKDFGTGLYRCGGVYVPT